MSFFQELIEAAKKAAKTNREPVEVAEWADVLGDRKLYVQQMSLEDRDAWEAEGLEKKGNEYEPKLQNIRARLICWTLVDEDGNKVFPNTETAKELPAYIGVPIYKQAHVLNRLSQIDIEVLAKNSESGPTAAL